MRTKKVGTMFSPKMTTGVKPVKRLVKKVGRKR